MIHDVAVIGAGLSGLAAARHLAAGGLDVVILEKSRGPGGRAATRNIDLPDGRVLRVDHGAQFFTAKDSLFRNQVDSWLDRGICFEWATGFHTWDGVSALPPGKQWEAPRYACRRGMSALGKDLATGLRILTGFRVGAVAHDRDGWLVSPADSASGDPLKARALFSSEPVPQSLELIGKHIPDEERRLLGRIAYGSCLAVMAFFEEMAVVPEWKGIQVRDPDSPLSWMAWDSSRRTPESPRGSMILHASPDFSAREELSAQEGREDARLEMLRAAARIGGEWMGSPTLSATHFWRYAIPLTGGAEGGFLCSSGEGRLYLIGDGLQGGRIEGAWISGFQAARDYLAKCS
jgi:renalase